MKIEKWIRENCNNLKGKCIAITGASGDLGKEVCFALASLGANLLLINRNKSKSNKLKEEILSKYGDIKIYEIILNLECFSDVKNNIDKIISYQIDVLILNAGSYKLERRISDIGYDNVYQINFVSQYYIAKKVIEKMKQRKQGKVVMVSSIAHNYSKIDANDLDFKNKKRCSKVYGNSKRFLMYSLFELFKDEKDIKLSIVHPGISYTNITSHYPKWIFTFIKYPMKMIFNKPRKASLSILRGVFEECGYHEWIGPSIFDVWGYPKKKKVTTCMKQESEYIFKEAERIYKEL